LGRVILLEVTKKVKDFIFYLGKFNRRYPGWRHLRHLHLYPPRDFVSSPSSYHSAKGSLDYSSSFQLVVWLLPSFTVSAISVCIIGILLGPIYPIAMKHIARVVPGDLVNGTIGWTSACGGTGVALLSLLTGSMASKWGIGILQPLCVFQSLHP
jgi:MFS family permease